MDVRPLDAPVRPVARAEALCAQPHAIPPSFWLNTLVTLIILLGQSVQDSVIGKDVYTAFAVRMGLFIAVGLYACLVLQLLDQERRMPRQPRAFKSP
jgi:hypothetical protein